MNSVKTPEDFIEHAITVMSCDLVFEDPTAKQIWISNNIDKIVTKAMSLHLAEANNTKGLRLEQK